jgi:hypothetical protein
MREYFDMLDSLNFLSDIENIENKEEIHDNTIDSGIYHKCLKIVQHEIKCRVLLLNKNESSTISLAKSLIDSYQMKMNYTPEYLSKIDYQNLISLLLNKFSANVGDEGVFHADLLIEFSRIYINYNEEELFNKFISEAREIYQDNTHIAGVKNKLEQLNSGYHIVDLELESYEPDMDGESYLEFCIEQSIEENDHK